MTINKKYAVLVVLAVVITAANYLFHRKSNTVDETKVVVLDSIFDIGAVEYGAKATAVFRLKNIGDKTLKIDGVKPDCYCTVPTLTRNEVAPGETAEIVVDYDSTREGYFSSTVAFDLNTSRKSYLLILRGLVKPKPI